MYINLDLKVQLIKTPFAPFTNGINRDFPLSEHLTTGEYIDSIKGYSDSFILENGLPVHPNFLEVFELIRKHTKKPLFIGSSVRSYNHELKKGRSGDSQHVHALAYDLNGQNLTKVIDEALKEKNALYYQLRELGVNAFGRYDWGYHLDFRENKPNNDIYYWDFSNKEPLQFWYVLLPLILVFYKPILKLIKYV